MKQVDEIGFTMETVFYWDAETEAIAFTQLSNNGIHGRGTVVSENGMITLVGNSIRVGELAEFRQTFEIMPDGTLEDCYYRRAFDSWIPEHIILYEQRP